MPSPLPGMDPYLEQPAFWSSFHSRFMVALADAIEANLSADYYVEVEARTYLDDSAGGVLIGIPDVVVAAPSAVDKLPTAIAGPIAVQVKPQSVEVPVPEAITERYLEIREVATGSVITAIELLSPKNKRADSGRTSYVEKRAQVLGFRGKPLVQIAYLRNDGTPVALCIIPAGPDAKGVSMGAAEGLDVARWNTPGYGFLLIGGQDGEPLAREAETFQEWSQDIAT